MTSIARTAVLVDDEANLTTHLQDKLQRLWPELNVLGCAANGRQALKLCTELQPDIVFLDIHMPGLSGLEVAVQLPPTTQIVFVTAYDEYALQAFDKAAVDYLVKPIEDSRLLQPVHRLNSSEPLLANQGALQVLLNELERTRTNFLQRLCTFDLPENR